MQFGRTAGRRRRIGWAPGACGCQVRSLEIAICLMAGTLRRTKMVSALEVHDSQRSCNDCRTLLLYP